MSYILDALRRAEADRQRGQVPNLGVAQLAAAAHGAAPPRRLKFVLTAVVVALAVGAAGWLGWWRGATQPPLPPAEQAQAVPSSALPPVPASAAEPRWPQVVSAPPAVPAVSAGPATPARSAQLPSLAPAPAPSPPAAPAPAAALDAAPTLTTGVERPVATRPTKLAELTPDQRRELPPLVVNGSVWSDSAASRFVILNGQVLREGDTVAPGLVLEKLLPKSAQLRWRGLWLELPY